jgi:uncharacterized NAD(P)/FAD-binding protein YdhS
LAVLERLIYHFSREDRKGLKAEIHVVEPKAPGVGVYEQHTPDYFLLNTVCGQIDLFGHRYLNVEYTAPYEPLSFYEWLRANKYQTDDYGSQREVLRSDFLPRALLGRYLHWVFLTLIAHLPVNLSVRIHREYADDILSLGDREAIRLRNKETLVVDCAIVTVGHAETVSAAQDPVSAGRPLDAFPYQRLLSTVLPGQTVIVQGMGLTSVDVITCLTVGNGGKFERRGNGKLTYLPSGNEPVLLQCSRSGLPYLSRPARMEYELSSYTPTFVTKENIDRIKEQRKIDFRQDILPLLWQEMHSLYRLASKNGAELEFDPELRLWGENRSYEDSAAYQQAVLRQYGLDILEANQGAASKSAIELVRVLRDLFRYAVDFGGLTESSFVDFHSNIVPMLYRTAVGPPVRKAEELRALVEAGVLHYPFGKSPDIVFQNGKWMARSTRLKSAATRTADHLILGYVQPMPTKMSSVLLNNLFRSGRFKRLNSEVNGGIEINAAFNPISQSKESQPLLYVLGLITEGSRNLNLYIPSPESRLRAFLDADNCAADIVKKLQWVST